MRSAHIFILLLAFALITSCTNRGSVSVDEPVSLHESVPPAKSVLADEPISVAEPEPVPVDEPAWLDKFAGFRLTSSAFKANKRIPQRFTCEAGDLSPPLSWSEAPTGTQSFALIVDDPDAPARTWVHWVIYNIPSDEKGLPEGVPRDESLPDGTRQGITDFQHLGYDGPCPPPGTAHRYFFILYALDTTLDLKGEVTKEVLLQAMGEHILDQTELVGTYSR